MTNIDKDIASDIITNDTIHGMICDIVNDQLKANYSNYDKWSDEELADKMVEHFPTFMFGPTI